MSQETGTQSHTAASSQTAHNAEPLALEVHVRLVKNVLCHAS